MVRELLNGHLDKNTKADLKRIGCQEKVNLFTQMEIFMKEISKMIKEMGKVN